MSELRIVKFSEMNAIKLGLRNDKLYFKAEADKMIAKKDTKIIQLEAFIENYNRISREIIDNANHQKYKRCLAMAKVCYLKFVRYENYLLKLCASRLSTKPLSHLGLAERPPIFGKHSILVFFARQKENVLTYYSEGKRLACAKVALVNSNYFQ